MNSIVFITTIFPASEKYLDDFFLSLENQIEKKFDVLVINDGVDNIIFYFKKYSSLNLIEFKSHQSPAKNREFGIKKAKELKYKKLLWGDSDDFFPNNRISEIIKLLTIHNFVVNDLYVSRNGVVKKKLLGKHYQEGIYNIEDILDKNIIGFSNLALNAEIIPDNIDFSKDLIAVDWFFATILLLNNNSFYFTDRTFSYYRQHKKNTIGANNKLGIENIKLEIKVKLLHYSNLLSYLKEDVVWSKVLLEKKIELIALRDKILEPDFFEHYQNKLKNNSNKAFTGWWNNILTNK